MTNALPRRRLTAIAMAGILALLGLTNAHAQDAAQSPAGTNDAALVDRIKREVLRELMEQGGMDAAIDAGIERFVTRQRQARAEAEASECAAALGGNDAFWMYADRIYERTRSNGNGFPLDGLVPLAEEIGLDGAKFSDCVESGRYAARVQEDYEEGIAAGISGTPGNILLNNATGEAFARPGAAPVDALKPIVDRLLGDAR